jgi:hypothetical protein
MVRRIRIISITSMDIIKIIDFGKMEWGVFVLEKKGM